MVPVLTGENVTLRPPRDGDVEARFALGNDAEIIRMYGFDIDHLPDYTREMAANWVRRIAEHPCAWVIETDGTPIGEVRLDIADPDERRAALAVGIVDRNQLGRGLGPEAILLALSHAFGSLELHRVGVRVLSYNRRAIRAYEKCGFVAEGRERETAFVNGAWHDDIMMGLLEDEFARIASSA